MIHSVSITPLLIGLNMRRHFFLAVMLVSSFHLGNASAASLIVNGGFENQPNWNSGFSGDGSYTAFTGTAIPGWTIAPNHAATIHLTGGAFNYLTISGQYSLNTDGEGHFGNNVDIYQDFASVLGQNYNLTFNWKSWFGVGNARIDVQVSDANTNTVLFHGNYFDNPGSFGSGGPLHSESAFFLGTGNSLRLEIQHIPQSGFNDNQYIMDDFSVTAVNDVPEPATITLLGIGLISAAGYRLRRRRAMPLDSI
jgi:hypothetical protein